MKWESEQSKDKAIKNGIEVVIPHLKVRDWVHIPSVMHICTQMDALD